MTQKIIKIGTSAGVILPKPFMEKRGMRVGDPIKLDFGKNDTEFIITTLSPKISKKDEEIGNIALGIINRYRKDFEELADK